MPLSCVLQISARIHRGVMRSGLVQADSHLAGLAREKIRHDRPPFLVEWAARNRSVRGAIPVTGIGQIAFMAVQVRMHPSGIGARLVLHELVRPVPVAFRGPPQTLEWTGNVSRRRGSRE